MNVNTNSAITQSYQTSNIHKSDAIEKEKSVVTQSTSSIKSTDSRLMKEIKDDSNIFGMAFKENPKAMELLEKFTEGMGDEEESQFLWAIRLTGIEDELRAMQKYEGQPNAQELIERDVRQNSVRLQDNDVFADALANLFSEENEGVDTHTTELLRKFHAIYTSSYTSLDTRA